MPGIDLSTLTAPELRQLLRLARGRHDGLLIDRVEWEIAQRKSLESRVGVDLKRATPSLIEDGDVTIDEVRAFRRPEAGLPPPRPRRRGSGRVSAMLGGMVAGSALTAGAFAGVDSGWRLPATIGIPALPKMAFAEPQPAPRPVGPPKRIEVVTASSDAVAGVLAPGPFPAPPPPPPPPPIEVIETPPPAPVEVAEVMAPPIVEATEPPEPKAGKPKIEKAKVEKPKVAGTSKPAAKAKKTELAKKKPDAKAKAALKKPADKAKLAAKKDSRAKTAVAAKKDPKAKTAVAAKKDTKAKTAKAKTAKAKEPSKTKLAAKDKPKAKVAVKSPPKVTARAAVKTPKTTLAKAAAKPKPPAKTATKPKAQVAEAPQGEAHDTIGTLLARTQGAAQ